MGLSRVFSAAFLGLDATLVEVEVDITKDAENFSIVIVGLPDTAVRESKDRVLAAIKNSGFQTGKIRCTINLAPGDLKKERALYDLPIAIGILRSLKVIQEDHMFSEYLIVGELGLGGEVRPIYGALAIAMFARHLGKKGVFLPASNAKEAATIPDIEVIPIENLKEAIQFFQRLRSPSSVSCRPSSELFSKQTPPVDFDDIRGHAHAKRAMEIAAAGGHNVILSGPPGSGKTMLAKALVGIMPKLALEEALEVTKIYSIVGLLPSGQSLVTQRPFRAPHHTISYAGLIGGGTVPRPGEVSLAHNGILFLDEFPEFSRSVLEVLRQPLEDRKVTISRANGNFTFPTNFMCVAAMNPCPCGFLGHPDKQCRDTAIQITRYRNKISGPIWDRIDMHIEVPTLRYHDLIQAPSGECSGNIQGRVETARQQQYHRFGHVQTNALMSAKEIKQYCPLDKECEDLMRQVIDTMGLSPRVCNRLLRVARTIADLSNSPKMAQEHLMEAIAFRAPQVENP